MRRNSKPSTKATKRTRQQEIFDTEVSVFKDLCHAVDTPYARLMLERIKVKDWLGIANAPFPDVDADTFADDYLIQQVLRKCPRLPISINREKAATEKFLDSERVCRETNSLINQVTSDSYSPDRKTACLAIKPAILLKIKNIIRDVLGPLGEHELEFVERKSRFGPGATFHCKGKDLTPHKKLESAIGLTPSLRCFLGALEPKGWLETTSGYAVVNGSRATTVSKDALTDRFIAIEPSLNMRWQLGIGALIRRRLKLFGLDLKHQADRNRLRVRFAEICENATIDLSSASDTVAKELIRLLFPTRWTHLLFLFRSPQMLVDGKWIELEKISSMGNGFTFELETLLFYAVAKAFDEDPYVFGDDIIVSQACAPDVVRTLNVFGFSVNGKKTFLAGRFFESCGVDYWRGKNVRPFFFKKDEHEDHASAVIRMANAIRRYAHRRNLGHGCDSRFLSAWTNLLQRSPVAGQSCIPEGYGDVGVIKNFDEAAPTKLRHQHSGFQARTYGSRPVEVDVTDNLSGMLSSLDTSQEDTIDDRSARLNPFTKDSRGWIVARQFNQSHDLSPFGLQPTEFFRLDGTQWATGGIKASRTYQSMRGRNDKPKLRTMPVQHWHELGPWC